jgi:hypothetical protein
LDAENANRIAEQERIEKEKLLKELAQLKKMFKK